MKIQSMMKQRFSFWQLLVLLSLLTNFLFWTFPLAFERMSGGRSGERQGQTAGMIRIYCEDASRTFLKSPQVHYGNLAFNMEMSAFEWIQGRIAAAIDGPQCNSVETVSKVISVIFGVIGALVAAYLTMTIAGPFAGLLAAFFLTTNELWMRYATYSMLDTRMITCGLLAVLFSLRRKPILAFTFWSLLITQKPQSFSVFAPFWGIFEIILLKQQGKPFSTLWKNDKSFKILWSFTASMIVGYSYYAYSVALNTKNDLPWITWMGPRNYAWYFGKFSERLHFEFFKSLVLDWVKKSALIYPLLIALGIAAAKKLTKRNLKNISDTLRGAFLFSLPFLFARFLSYAVFYNVYIVHEYYALPLNAISAVTMGCTLGLFLKNKSEKKNIRLATGAFLFLICVIPMQRNLQAFVEFKSNVNNPKDWRYDAEWRTEVFPKAKSTDLVVMAGSGSGRDILPLYFTQKHGFAWCAKNEEFAPRAFWKEQGVKWVAWWKDYNRETRLNEWTVRSIDEELIRARDHKWSSDIKDVWASKSMQDWASFASQNNKDPCATDPTQWNPQNW